MWPRIIHTIRILLVPIPSICVTFVCIRVIDIIIIYDQGMLFPITIPLLFPITIPYAFSIDTSNAKGILLKRFRIGQKCATLNVVKQKTTAFLRWFCRVRVRCFVLARAWNPGDTHHMSFTAYRSLRDPKTQQKPEKINVVENCFDVPHERWSHSVHACDGYTSDSWTTIY